MVRISKDKVASRFSTAKLPSVSCLYHTALGTAIGVLLLARFNLLRYDNNGALSLFMAGAPTLNPSAALVVRTAENQVSHKSPLAYGTKSGGNQTAQLVRDAIALGFRHIVTGGHHQAHNESAVGEGWHLSGVPRKELFLQSAFVPWSVQDFRNEPLDPPKTPETVEYQVILGLQTSLRNLRTDYLDAIVFHNFRAKLQPYHEVLQTWRVFEDYHRKGKIRNLGIANVHDMKFLKQLYRDAKVKPTIVQNRFHSNRGYDIDNQETFRKGLHPLSTHPDDSVQLQRFWLLNGSSNQGRANKDMALAKGLTPQQLLLAFVMSLGSNTALVGTHNIQHMKDDLDIAKCYPAVFENDEERQKYAQKMGFRPKEWDLYDKVSKLKNDKNPHYKDYQTCLQYMKKQERMRR